MNESYVLSELILCIVPRQFYRPLKLDQFSEFSCFNLDFYKPSITVLPNRANRVWTVENHLYLHHLFSIARYIIFQTELYYQTIISLLSIVNNRYLNASHIYKFNHESNVIPMDLTSRNFPRLAYFQDMVKFYRFSLKNIWTKKYNYLYYIIHMHNLNFNDRFFRIIQFCFI